ncbi:hypothetical protein [Aliamphritea ceti]|uniref:hypothetical protein n=1 Tax=Aliamphritea ceti TaxID=1524258 RepID=UPI0021C3ADB7|nr:hypothetical protein [Aliamphritea ceti]
MNKQRVVSDTELLETVTGMIGGLLGSLRRADVSMRIDIDGDRVSAVLDRGECCSVSISELIDAAVEMGLPSELTDMLTEGASEELSELLCSASNK